MTAEDTTIRTPNEIRAQTRFSTHPLQPADISIDADGVARKTEYGRDFTAQGDETGVMELDAWSRACLVGELEGVTGLPVSLGLDPRNQPGCIVEICICHREYTISTNLGGCEAAIVVIRQLGLVNPFVSWRIDSGRADSRNPA